MKSHTLRALALSFTSLLAILSPPLHAGADLRGRPPEEFKWENYVGEGQSTVGEMTRAQEGAAALQKRVEELRAAYRKLFIKRGEKESLRLFDEMEAHWQKSADAQVNLIGNSWEGGSGQKAAIPLARMNALLFHIKELLYLKSACQELNE